MVIISVCPLPRWEGGEQSEFPFTKLAVITPARAFILPWNKTLDQFDCIGKQLRYSSNPKQEVGGNKGKWFGFVLIINLY